MNLKLPVILLKIFVIALIFENKIVFSAANSTLIQELSNSNFS